ncbi:MAG TPA: adenylate/guanylate cyclase domain-containing protein [Saprospiraceae bacterium]|nr:adenylate/guanylate cyclase domain-containing protein [Saprospiraceae bacterium]
MTRSLFLISSFVIHLFYFTAPFQNDKKTLEKELSSLKGSLYIKKAIQIGESELNGSSQENALYFFKKGYSYSQDNTSIQSTAVVGYEIVGKIVGKTNDEKLNEFCIQLLEVAADNLNDKNILTNIHNYAKQIMPFISTKSKKRLEVVINKTKIAWEESQNKQKQQLEEERRKQKQIEDSINLLQTQSQIENLSSNVEQLQNTSNFLTTRMNESELLIKNMSRENLIKEALLQRNTRYIDSLNFEKMLDSIIIESNNFELERTESALNLQKSQKNLFLAIAALFLLISLMVFIFFYNAKKNNTILKEKNIIIENEKKRSDELLLNILPKEVAEELKETGKVKAQQFDDTTIIFTDFVNFSKISSVLTPQELVNDLDYCFGKFDSIIEKYGVEKIKTIGDAYMCIAGVPKADEDHANNAINTGLDFLKFIRKWNTDRIKKGQIEFNIRIGIHSGPVCAGVVGSKKFIFDVWGDTVNVAARMESNAYPNTINISENTYSIVKDSFNFTPRGAVSTKNMGELNMYYI